MKATVSLTTYNHAPFIGQAIESVLMQQARFDFELLIGEDDSTDGTRGIVKGYETRYPQRIRLLLHDKKDVIYVNGRATGQWNFANNIRNARGEYVALLEGDDYWTSPLKLQQQVDFLEGHRDCAICFHSVQVRDDRDPQNAPVLRPDGPRDRYEIEDLLKGNFLYTCSVAFRAGLFSDFPSWFFKSPIGDWPLHVLNAQHGWIGYLDEVMAVYRKHAGGFWSTQPRLRVLTESLQAADYIRTSLTPAQSRHLDAGVEVWLREMIDLHCAQGEEAAAARVALSYFRRLLFRTKTRPWRIFRSLILRRPGRMLRGLRARAPDRSPDAK